MERKLNSKFILVTLVACGAVSFSCNESLPPREDPPRVLDIAMSVEEGPAIIEDSANVGFFGGVNIAVTNIYDEVLQDSALISGSVELWMEDDPTQRATIPISVTALQNPSIVFQGQLTLRVNQTAFFAKQWSQRTDDGIYFWRFVNLTKYVDSMGRVYFVSDSIRFVARASMQIFQKAQSVRTQEIRYFMNYIIR